MTSRKLKKCPPGKILRKETNRCVNKPKTKKSLKKVCPPGKVLRKETNRCVNEPKIPTKVEKVCPPGKMLRKETNRCVNIPKTKVKPTIAKPYVKPNSIKPSQPKVQSIQPKVQSIVKPISDKLLKQISKESSIFIDLLKKKNIKVTKFKGSGYDTLFGLVYLIRKYNNACLPLYIPSNMDIMQDIFEISSIAWRCSNQFLSGTSEQSGDIKNYKIFYPVTNDLREASSLDSETHFFDLIKKCQNNGKQFAIVNLSLSWDCGRSGNHSNAILFDYKNKTAERFEPYGAYVSNKDDIKLVKEFDKQFGKAVSRHTNFKYMPAHLFCPLIGPQKHDELRKRLGKDLSENEKKKKTDPYGFCASWSLWYINLRLEHPNISPKQLLDKALKKLHNDPRSFTTFIRNYSQFIIKEREALMKKYNLNHKNGNKIEFNRFIKDEIIKIIEDHI